MKKEIKKLKNKS